LQRKKRETRLGQLGQFIMALEMHHGIAVLLTMAYSVGSPEVAPMLPRPIEMSFSKLHKEFNEIGVAAYRSGEVWVQNISQLMETRPAPVSAPAAP
jgi:hypothetical protein